MKSIKSAVRRMRWYCLAPSHALRRRLHRRALSTLGAAERDIVEELRRDGFAVRRIEDFEMGSPGAADGELDRLVEELVSVRAGADDIYVHAEGGSVANHPRVLLWGLQERILRIAEHHIGSRPCYKGVRASRSPRTTAVKGSRLWHLDYQDRGMLRVVVYLKPVDAESGAMQVVPRRWTARIVRRMLFFFPPFGDEAMARIVPRSEWRTLEGPAGMVVFLDASATFHRGLLPRKAERFALFYEYTSQHPVNPATCRPSYGMRDVALFGTELTAFQAAALEPGELH